MIDKYYADILGMNKGGTAKIKKVAKALHKASGLHKQQAKTLDAITKKRFDEGGLSELDFPKYFKSGKKKPKPSLAEQEKDTGDYDYGVEQSVDVIEIPTFKKGGDNMPKRNKKNFRPTEKGAGMTQAGVAAYRRANPGSKLKTAVTGKVKPGSKDAKRRKSFCARSAGQMKKFPKAAKDPNSRLRQARRRWKC